ncbi:MAG: DUF2972 domain-containing protein, partial [Helicobacter sp.]|nr:DUF2972 domain-containing protein [Helicobacter sp.]
HLQPYPNLSYKDIPAELAWEMNLPLVRGYKFIWLDILGCGGNAIKHLWGVCGVRTNERFRISDKDIYLQSYRNILCHDKVAIWLKARNFGGEWENVKLYYLITHKVPAFCVVRDPISILKAFVNHLNGDLGVITRKVNLTFAYEDIILDIIYLYGKPTPSFKWLENYTGFDNTLNQRIRKLSTKDSIVDINYIPFESISPSNAYQTFCSLVLQLGFDEPKNRKPFESKINGHDRHYLFPFSLFLHPQDIENLYQDSKENHQRNEDSLKSEESIEVIVALDHHTQFCNQEFKNITAWILEDRDYQLNYRVSIYLKAKDFPLDLELLQAAKTYLLGYMETLEKKELEEKKKLFKEKDILEYFKANKEVREKYQVFFNEDYQHIREVRPDLVESWKYYQEFLKICKEG